MLWTQGLRLRRGYAEGRTEVYLSRSDHIGVRKADRAVHTPLQSWEWSSRLLALATPPVLSGFSVGNSAILYSAYPHKNESLLLPSAAPWAGEVELSAMIPKALSCRMLVLWIALLWVLEVKHRQHSCCFGFFLCWMLEYGILIFSFFFSFGVQ